MIEFELIKGGTFLMGGNKMDKVLINSETIKKAIDKYVPQEIQEKFYKLTDTYLEQNIKIIFNGIYFDYSKLTLPMAINESVDDYLRDIYGEEFMELFRHLTKNCFNIIAIIE